MRGLTDQSGNIVELYAYSPYGKHTIISSTATTNNSYGFTGRYLDVETGLWYFRARYFNDEMGRFVTRDPLGYVDGMNLYAGYFAEGFRLDPYGNAELKITTTLMNPPTDFVFPNFVEANKVWKGISLSTGHPILTFKQDPATAEKVFYFDKTKDCWICWYEDTHNWWKFKVAHTRFRDTNDEIIKALIKFTIEHEERRAQVNEMFREIMENAEHDIADYQCTGKTKDICKKRLDKRASAYMTHILSKAHAWRRAQQEKINKENNINLIYKKDINGDTVVHPEDPKIIQKWIYRLPEHTPGTDKEARKFPCPKK